VRPYFETATGPIPGLVDALRASSGKLVEVGGGDGTKLRALIDAGATAAFDAVVMTDVSEVRTRRARELLPEASAVSADALDLPFESDSVDFVLSDQVIEHVADDVAMAREVYRVLRPGGRACIGSVMKRRWAWYFHRNNGRWVLDPTHVREYGSTAEFRAPFERAGFVVDGVRVAPMPYPVGELAIRALVRLGIVNAADSVPLYRRSRVLRSLSKLQAAVPGYFGCWAYLAKRRSR
jgi:SAM-dependent methyltransferase